MLQRASLRHIPRGARSDARPWVLDPELEEVVEERRSARRDLRRGDRSAKERWVAAKQRAASVERRVTQRHFREFVSTHLNRHQNLGRNLRRRVRPRAAQLRKMTGRSWGLQEQQLRAVANGYLRGALEHAAAAWLPAAPKTNVELLEREMRAAARIVTGCIRSAPHQGVMAEAGILPVAAHRTALAARRLAKATTLPPDDPLHALAVAESWSRASHHRDDP